MRRDRYDTPEAPAEVVLDRLMLALAAAVLLAVLFGWL
jgi:hypothetical protein